MRAGEPEGKSMSTMSTKRGPRWSHLVRNAGLASILLVGLSILGYRAAIAVAKPPLSPEILITGELVHPDGADYSGVVSIVLEQETTAGHRIWGPYEVDVTSGIIAFQGTLDGFQAAARGSFAIHPVPAGEVPNVETRIWFDPDAGRMASAAFLVDEVTSTGTSLADVSTLVLAAPPKFAELEIQSNSQQTMAVLVCAGSSGGLAWLESNAEVSTLATNVPTPLYSWSPHGLLTMAVPTSDGIGLALTTYPRGLSIVANPHRVVDVIVTYDAAAHPSAKNYCLIEGPGYSPYTPYPLSLIHI